MEEITSLNATILSTGGDATLIADLRAAQLDHAKALAKQKEGDATKAAAEAARLVAVAVEATEEECRTALDKANAAKNEAEEAKRKLNIALASSQANLKATVDNAEAAATAASKRSGR